MFKYSNALCILFFEHGENKFETGIGERSLSSLLMYSIHLYVDIGHFHVENKKIDTFSEHSRLLKPS